MNGDPESVDSIVNYVTHYLSPEPALNLELFISINEIEHSLTLALCVLLDLNLKGKLQISNGSSNFN